MSTEQRAPTNIWSPRPDAQPLEYITEDICLVGKPVQHIHQQMLSRSSTAVVQSAEVVIFTSHHSVIHYLGQPQAPSLDDKYVIAIGKRTSATLVKYDIPVSMIAPAPHSSETLLNSSDFQALPYSNYAIISGTNGRQQLENILKAQKKSVHTCHCYRRDKANLSAQVMLEFIVRYKIAGIIITSTEISDIITDVCHDIPEHAQQLLSLPVFVLSDRIAQHCRRHRFNTVITAKSANLEHLQSTIIQWWTQEST